jgi:hypothetical protein
MVFSEVKSCEAKDASLFTPFSCQALIFFFHYIPLLRAYRVAK